MLFPFPPRSVVVLAGLTQIQRAGGQGGRLVFIPGHNWGIRKVWGRGGGGGGEEAGADPVLQHSKILQDDYPKNSLPLRPPPRPPPTSSQSCKTNMLVLV